MVEDLGSKNGTTIGGKRLRGPRALRVGDRLGVGSNEWDVR
jgi:pSer/pThr/pTyr-binding forkhead associated (FHA) protein